MRSRQAADDSTRPILLISPRQREFLLDGYRELIAVDGGTEAHLAAVLSDAVTHPGSFVRAQIAFDVARRHDVGRDRARALAVAVEYFHTASLIFDDLPMMDNARQRRGRPCPHRVHGEAAAVLGALSLIDRAYALVWEVLAEIPAARSRRAGELITTCLGARGVLGGQSRDLHPTPGALSEEDILAVALGKTVPLIRLTLLLPALAGGADDAELEGLDRLAHCWGLAYQILDDCKDALMASSETGKSTARDGLLGRPNLLNHSGPERVQRRLAQLLAESRTHLEELGRRRPGNALERLQRLLDSEYAKVRFCMSRTAAAGAADLAAKPAEAAAC